MDIDELAECAAALGTASRLKIVEVLRDGPPEGLASGEIARMLGVPQNTLSTQLAILGRARLVRRRRESRMIYCTLNATTWTALHRWTAAFKKSAKRPWG